MIEDKDNGIHKSTFWKSKSKSMQLSLARTIINSKNTVSISTKDKVDVKFSKELLLMMSESYRLSCQDVKWVNLNTILLPDVSSMTLISLRNVLHGWALGNSVSKFIFLNSP